MRLFLYLIFAVVTVVPYISDPDTHLAPGATKFLVELVSAVAVVYVFTAGVRQQFRYVNGKYWLIFGALTLTVVCGPLVNQEAVGPIVNGMRYYLRAIPLFFLPAVIDFSDRDIERYLKFILALSLLQVPVEVYQRITHVAYGNYSGDFVSGTMLQSGYVSLFLIAVMCVMSAFMLRGKMSKINFGVCFLLLVIAVSINETKVTILLLPLALPVTFVLAAPSGRRLLATMQALAFLTIFGFIFVPVYDALNKKNDNTPGPGILEFFSDPDMVSHYVTTNAGVGTGKEAGRGDALSTPFASLSRDPIKLTFGLGLGNVSKSSLGEQFSGRYMQLYWRFALLLSISTFLFEIGLLGTLLVLLLHWMILRDALFVAKHDEGTVGTLALGYVGVWLTVTIGLFYVTVHLSEPISYVFWFISGVIVARRQRLKITRIKSKPALPIALVPMNRRAGGAA